ncbi:sigma factor-like helix-turn-helix DNA-binding protein [Chengkuizengella axinellae]|uniref:Sigma factor-like helix-turn-helix DNA-binding protein n=1 Tax=Chengkuizengella axinellae TaxID=3064388 RepID=A0ABT9IWP8_9BACL|nr:sigma factor-like helix-turn-helix DNA-binding protein [Chengkuizengella sp. 2205SS18-9]MDP5273210.1 sigma factor-like helix-turn-helix DNA-binding protein [Chengkuizengella sp. 2205SS18-9]
MKKLLQDHHHIAERRYKGDMAASDMLMDLQTAVQLAMLTRRQAEALRLVYVYQMKQKEAAVKMDVTQQAVEQFINGACNRIAGVYKKWNEIDGSEVGK